MLRVVFDTNVLVSIIIRSGKPRELWNYVMDGRISLILSDELIEEFNDVVSRSQLKRYLKRPRLMRFQRVLIQLAKIYTIRTHFRLVTADSDDNMVLDAAYSGRADYITSGDKHLLRLGEFKGIRIVTVDGMIKILKGRG
jgi:hypothetical protein